MNEQAMNPLNQIAELLNSTNLLSPTKSSNFGKQEGIGNAIYDCSPYVLLYQQMQLEQNFYEGIAKQYCLCDIVSFPQAGAPQKLKTNESDCPKSRDSNQQYVTEIIESKKLEIKEAIKNMPLEKILIKANPKKKHSGPRSSKFRGVSLNGKKWQTLVMGPNKNAYRGRHVREQDAAKDYDRHSILRQGLCAKTNFNYTVKELFQIVSIENYF
eukprot:CAMPEP_0197000686 /NCGR_PEP_ID=MMETSP1380-20130617/5561_1 /TAXON_ID=5936 /ORGANISM="Euplotes crassus, Strain CT5" /LENGTH=212 /DNA_ID=CAMNT_0042418065 /DNA_START=29 /DNA_END=667 /DNA_ORIENTATION=-